MHEMFKIPTSGKGFMGYVLLGFGGAIAAMLVGSFFPSIIPSSVKNVRI